MSTTTTTTTTAMGRDIRLERITVALRSAGYILQMRWIGQHRVTCIVSARPAGSGKRKRKVFLIYPTSTP